MGSTGLKDVLVDDTHPVELFEIHMFTNSGMFLLFHIIGSIQDDFTASSIKPWDIFPQA